MSHPDPNCRGDGGAQRSKRGSWHWGRVVAVATGVMASALALEAPASLLAQQPAGPGLIVNTVAGGGTAPGVDGGDPLAMALSRPEDIATGPDGSVYLADSFGHRVWRVTPDGVLSAVAGTGQPGYSGDDGPAVRAQLNHPEGLAVGQDGSVYIGDTVNRRVRRVAPDGTITTVAGTGQRGYDWRPGPAVESHLSDPHDLAVAPDGTLYLVDEQGGEVRAVTPDGTLRTLELYLNPFGVAVGADGALYVSDGTTHQVWQVGRDGGSQAVVAGTGEPGDSGDGGPASQAQLNRPEGLAVDGDGALYIADRDNHRVRRVDADGTISTVAGTGEPGVSGDGVPATDAVLDQPHQVAVGVEGVLLTDLGSARVRVLVAVEAPPATSTTAPTTSTTTSSTTTSSTTSTSTTTTEPPTTSSTTTEPPPSTTVPTTSTSTTSTTTEPPTTSTTVPTTSTTSTTSSSTTTSVPTTTTTAPPPAPPPPSAPPPPGDTTSTAPPTTTTTAAPPSGTTSTVSLPSPGTTSAPTTTAPTDDASSDPNRRGGPAADDGGRGADDDQGAPGPGERTSPAGQGSESAVDSGAPGSRRTTTTTSAADDARSGNDPDGQDDGDGGQAREESNRGGGGEVSAPELGDQDEESSSLFTFNLSRTAALVLVVGAAGIAAVALGIWMDRRFPTS